MVRVRRLPLSLAVLGLALLTVLSPATAGARPAGTLSVSRSSAGDGEYVTLAGTIGTQVRRTAILQLQSGSWQDVKRVQTTATGGFSVQIHVAGGTSASTYRMYAPAAHVGGRSYPAAATPSRRVSVTPQDITLSYPGLEAVRLPSASGNLFNDQAVPGSSVRMSATIAPVRAGRPVTLQMRNPDGSWSDVAGPTPADAGGQVTWSGVTLPLTLPVAYRAVAQAYDGMSAYESNPRYIWAPGQELTSGLLGSDPIGGSGVTLSPQPGPVSAGSTFKWGNPVENYSWESGESIAPWTEYSDGTGRVTNYIAMLTLDSGLQDGRFRGFGDISSTLGTAGHAYGRWEMRVRAPIFPVAGASIGKNYGVRLQLVPAGSSPTYDCSDAITLGQFDGYGSTTTIGANNGTDSWTTTIPGAQRNRDNWHTYAVEVTPKRISWFIDAKVVATVDNAAAVTGQSLVPRLALDGAGDGVWMNHTKLTADWVRYFSLDRPDARSTSAPAPTKGAFSGSC